MDMIGQSQSQRKFMSGILRDSLQIESCSKKESLGMGRKTNEPSHTPIGRQAKKAHSSEYANDTNAEI